MSAQNCICFVPQVEPKKVSGHQTLVLIDGDKPISKKHKKKLQLYLSIRPGRMGGVGDWGHPRGGKFS